MHVPETRRIIKRLHQLGRLACDDASGQRTMTEDIAQAGTEPVPHLSNSVMSEAGGSVRVAAVLDERNFSVSGAEHMII